MDLDEVLQSLLDHAGAPQGALPGRCAGWWDRLVAIASDARILLPLTPQLLDRYGGSIPAPVRSSIMGTLIAHKTRNALLIQQIVQLAELFEHAGIPVMFLKGAAGLARGLYRPDERVLTDIDLLAAPDRLDDALDLLRAEGYRPTDKIVPPFHHHREPFGHPKHAGQVEVHVEPYDLTMLERPALDTLWRDSEQAILRGCPVTVPSLTDHAWILIRSAFTEKVFLPRLMDAYELAAIETAVPGGIDFDELLIRARRRHLTPLAGGFAASAETYFGTSLPLPSSPGHIRRWRDWSTALYHTYGSEQRVPMYRKRFLLLGFAVDRGLIPKLTVLRWLIRYEDLYDRYRPGSRGLFAGRFGRLIKDIASYLLCLLEYSLRRVLPKAPFHLGTAAPSPDHFRG